MIMLKMLTHDKRLMMVTFEYNASELLIKIFQFLHLGLVLISSLMIVTSAAMFTFPKHLKGNRIPPPEKVREMEAQKKLGKHEEESKPQLKGTELDLTQGASRHHFL